LAVEYALAMQKKDVAKLKDLQEVYEQRIQPAIRRESLEQSSIQISTILNTCIQHKHSTRRHADVHQCLRDEQYPQHAEYFGMLGIVITPRAVVNILMAKCVELMMYACVHVLSM
jgi:hypothetical protein